jgi:peptidyl-prolyl cis-trans isomerase C
MKLSKDRMRFLLTIPLMVFGVFAVIFSSAGAQETAETVLATVNGVAVTQQDLDKEFNRINMQAASRNQPIDAANVPAIKKNILETLINRELLYQESKAKGISVAPSELENSLEKIKQRITPGKSFAEALAEINISEKEFKDTIEKAMMIQKLMDAEIFQKISITEKETRIFYDNNPQFFKKPEQVKASHILIQVAADADEETRKQARKRIEEIQQKLRQGDDFASLAEKYSDCPSSKNGGDLGTFDRNKMVKPFSDAAFSLEPGSVSDIVETQFGYHLIKVFEKIPETKLAYKDIQERISQTMKNQKIQNETSAYISQLKENAHIQRTFP